MDLPFQAPRGPMERRLDRLAWLRMEQGDALSTSDLIRCLRYGTSHSVGDLTLRRLATRAASIELGRESAR